MTQGQFIENKLLANGQITRNECLKEFITRLSSFICNLNANGYVIEGKTSISTYKTRWGIKNDYIYKVVKKPINKYYTKEEEM